MNAKLCAAAIAMAVLSLSGCKTTESAAMARPDDTAHKVGTTYDPRIEVDAEYVSHVQKLALRRGVFVRWVNKPHKRVVDQAAQ